MELEISAVYFDDTRRSVFSAADTRAPGKIGFAAFFHIEAAAVDDDVAAVTAVALRAAEDRVQSVIRVINMRVELAGIFGLTVDIQLGARRYGDTVGERQCRAVAQDNVRRAAIHK